MIVVKNLLCLLLLLFEILLPEWSPYLLTVDGALEPAPRRHLNLGSWSLVGRLYWIKLWVVLVSTLGSCPH